MVLYALIGMLDVLDIGLLGHTHLVGKGGVRYPAGGLARCGLLEHAVDLLEGKALGLGDEEVDVHEAEYEHAEEDEQDERPDVLRDARGEEGEEEVPDPVCAKEKRDELGTRRTEGERYALDALPSAMALGRTRSGKLSPRYTHGVGPQKMENEKT